MNRSICLMCVLAAIVLLTACDAPDGAGWYIDVAYKNGDGGKLTNYQSGHDYLCLESLDDAVHVGSEIEKTGAWYGRVWYAPCGQPHGTAYEIRFPLNIDIPWSVGKWPMGIDPYSGNHWNFANQEQSDGVANALCYLLTRGRLKQVQEIQSVYWSGHDDDAEIPTEAGCTATDWRQNGSWHRRTRPNFDGNQ